MLRSQMIDSVFLVRSILEKHRNAPLVEERERYLTYLFEIGTCRDRLRDIATLLLHVVRLLNLESMRPVGMNEILRGCDHWLADPNARRHRKSGVGSPRAFRIVATNWLRFQGALIAAPKPQPLFGGHLAEFTNAMRLERGLTLGTIRTYRYRILAFFDWLALRYNDFPDVRASDVEEYIQERQSKGLRRTSVAANCRALRTFFEYAEKEQWCPYGIRNSISSPRIPRIAGNQVGPRWDEVRKIIASIGNIRKADLRAKAMILLLSVYGLRSIETRSLNLEDIDWLRGTITVRRAKSGRLQQFPLQNEVGEAIAMYLEKARPKCICRNVFVTLRPPYRPVFGSSMSKILGPRITALGMPAKQFGPHMLRRACATQLLRTGIPIREIADFLGHSNLRSVSSYAKFEPASLKNVARFSLRGIL